MADKPKTNYIWIGIAFVVVIVLAFIFISNSNKSQEVICNSPYIKVGTFCCIDKDNNNICDNDQPKIELIEDCIQENVVGKCSTDGECMAMDKAYCGHLLPEDCKFEPYGGIICNGVYIPYP
ncbi:MAG: hypothetical protein IB618_01870 [Candidatus Pacearchaeota archaeon]|nr:MAG: hypothetical protein IB618_01870 [Candidatus Pacearchaeota archaeon]